MIADLLSGAVGIGSAVVAKKAAKEQNQAALVNQILYSKTSAQANQDKFNRTVTYLSIGGAIVIVLVLIVLLLKK